MYRKILKEEREVNLAGGPLKLLHCIHSIDRRGGGLAGFMQQLCDVQSELHFEMEIACLDHPSHVDSSCFNCAVHALGPSQPGYGYTNKFIPWLQKHHKNYDAVLVQGLWQFHSVATWLALRQSRSPYFVYPHGMLDPWFNQAYPAKFLKKSFYWLIAERFVLKDARAVLFTCEEEALLARNSFYPYQGNEVVVGHGTLPPPGDPAAMRRLFAEQHPSLTDRRILLYLGRLHPKKGIDLLLPAFEQVCLTNSDLQLLLVGPCEPGYEAVVEQLLLQLSPATRRRVHRIDMLYGEMKWGAILSAEAMILPSHQENFGQSLSEALSCGVPVLISNKVNIWRQISAGEAGFVEADNMEGTTSLIRRWLALTASERQSMKTKARDCYGKYFRLQEAVSRQLRTISESLVPPALKR